MVYSYTGLGAVFQIRSLGPVQVSVLQYARTTVPMLILFTELAGV